MPLGNPRFLHNGMGLWKSHVCFCPAFLSVRALGWSPRVIKAKRTSRDPMGRILRYVGSINLCDQQLTKSWPTVTLASFWRCHLATWPLKKSDCTGTPNHKRFRRQHTSPAKKASEKSSDFQLRKLMAFLYTQSPKKKIHAVMALYQL